jgi:hypothetical protein
MNEKKFLQVASKAIGSKITKTSTSNNTEKWDSLGQLQLLASLDKHTKGKTSKINNLAEADTIKKIINILKKNKILKD